MSLKSARITIPVPGLQLLILICNLKKERLGNLERGSAAVNDTLGRINTVMFPQSRAPLLYISNSFPAHSDSSKLLLFFF